MRTALHEHVSPIKRDSLDTLIASTGTLHNSTRSHVDVLLLKAESIIGKDVLQPSHVCQQSAARDMVQEEILGLEARCANYKPRQKSLRGSCKIPRWTSCARLKTQCKVWSSALPMADQRRRSVRTCRLLARSWSGGIKRSRSANLGRPSTVNQHGSRGNIDKRVRNLAAWTRHFGGARR